MAEFTIEQRNQLMMDIKAQVPDMPKAVEEYLLSLNANDFADVKSTLKANHKGFTALINDDVKLKVAVDGNGGYAIGLYNKDLSKVYTEHNTENAMGQSFSYKDEEGSEFRKSEQFERKEGGEVTAHDSVYIKTDEEIKSTYTDAEFSPDGKSMGFTTVVSEAEIDENNQVKDGTVSQLKSNVKVGEMSFQVNDVSFNRSADEGGSLTPDEMETLVKNITEDNKFTSDEAEILNEKGADYKYFANTNVVDGKVTATIQANGNDAIEDAIGDFNKYSAEAQKKFSDALEKRYPEVNARENRKSMVEFESKDGKSKVSIEGQGENAVVSVTGVAKESDVKNQSVSFSNVTPKVNEEGKLDSRIVNIYKDYFSK